MSPLIAFRKPVTFGPNVTGTASQVFRREFSVISSGVFSQSVVGTDRAIVASGSDGGYSFLNFSAFDSNSTYTDNGKVYPASVALNYVIKI